MKTEMMMLEELKAVVGEMDEAEAHHTFINDCLAVLTDARIPLEEKQASLSIFVSILRMHVHLQGMNRKELRAGMARSS